MTTFDIGQGLLILLGSIVTTCGGVVILYMTQRAEFRKAREAAAAAEKVRAELAAEKKEQAERTAAELARKTEETAEGLKQAAADIARKTEEAAAELARKTTEAAEDLKQVVKTDIENKDSQLHALKQVVKVDNKKKDAQLHELHSMVDGQLSAATLEIAELKRIIAKLIASQPHRRKALTAAEKATIDAAVDKPLARQRGK